MHDLHVIQGPNVTRDARKKIAFFAFHAFVVEDSRFQQNRVRTKLVITPGGFLIYPWVGRCGAATHTLTNIADFPTLFKTEFRFFNTLFKTFNPNIN